MASCINITRLDTCCGSAAFVVPILARVAMQIEHFDRAISIVPKSRVTMVTRNILDGRALVGTRKIPCTTSVWELRFGESISCETQLYCDMYRTDYSSAGARLTTQASQLRNICGLVRATCYFANLEFHSGLY